MQKTSFLDSVESCKDLAMCTCPEGSENILSIAVVGTLYTMHTFDLLCLCVGKSK